MGSEMCIRDSFFSSFMLRLFRDLSLMNYPSVREGKGGGTGSLDVSGGGTIVDGYLLGHRRFNSGFSRGWGCWFSLGPRWSGVPARVSASGSVGGDRVTEGDIARRRCIDNRLRRSILAIFSSAAVGAFTLRCSAFADSAWISAAGRESGALAAPSRFCGPLAAAVARIGRIDRSFRRSSSPDGCFRVRAVLGVTRGVASALLRCGDSAQVRPHRYGLNDAEAKKKMGAVPIKQQQKHRLLDGGQHNNQHDEMDSASAKKP